MTLTGFHLVLGHLVRRAAVEAFAAGYRESGFVSALEELQRELPC